MKTSIFAFVLLFALTPSTTAIYVVVDADGKPVKNPGKYYILPAISGQDGAGGIDLAKTGTDLCPLTVVQTFDEEEVSYGLPFFVTSLTKSPYIGSIISFATVSQPNCIYKALFSLPTSWTVVNGKDGMKQVKIATADDPPRGLFRLEIHQGTTYGYKILFCPREFESNCEALGISMDDKGNRLLVVKGDDPLVVKFRKADDQAFVQ